MKQRLTAWTQGTFYTLGGTPDSVGNPVLKATLTQPGVTSAIELIISVADFPIIGAPFKEDEMDVAKKAAELIIERFWPSDEAVKAIVTLMVQDEIGEEGPE